VSERIFSSKEGPERNLVPEKKESPHEDWDIKMGYSWDFKGNYWDIVGV
jgi:hypothetical protein